MTTSMITATMPMRLRKLRQRMCGETSLKKFRKL